MYVIVSVHCNISKEHERDREDCLTHVLKYKTKCKLLHYKVWKGEKEEKYHESNNFSHFYVRPRFSCPVLAFYKWIHILVFQRRKSFVIRHIFSLFFINASYFDSSPSIKFCQSLNQVFILLILTQIKDPHMLFALYFNTNASVSLDRDDEVSLR